jgi:hypothetical protein
LNIDRPFSSENFDVASCPLPESAIGFGVGSGVDVAVGTTGVGVVFGRIVVVGGGVDTGVSFSTHPANIAAAKIATMAVNVIICFFIFSLSPPFTMLIGGEA